MKGQIDLTDIEYANRKKITKREGFLNMMDEIIPWGEWIEYIRPCYPDGKRGRPVRGIETMLRMYLMQVWFNLSDEGIEDAIYDSYAMRSFLGINFMTEQVPDATTLLKFRHLLERNHIGELIFKDINERLDKAGLIMHGGTIVDATIVSAPSSTKNQKKERDQEIQILELHIVFTADIRRCFPKLTVLLIRLCFDIRFLTRKAGLGHSADQLFILFR
jgi:IS5 family transposase